ncbi:MAG TPA: RNA polymerase sigma factor [Bacteroidales bacterium]|mgnify:CR=1 FL=1|nr:RNA polymerase sigma factor [Bacteroidales bacterium]
MSEADFDNLVRNTGRRLYSMAYRFLRDQQASEDAVQEVFVKLWKMKSRLEEYESTEALATTMLKNHCIDQIRRGKHPSVTGNEKLLSFFDSQPSPYEKLVNEESYAIIRKIVDDLPELYREAVTLRDIEGLEYEDIAKKTGQNVNTVRVILSRGRKMIRDEMKKIYNEPGRNKNTA